MEQIMSRFDDITRRLADFSATKTVDEASRLVPPAPGLYAIHVADRAHIPNPWRAKLTARGTRLLYIGQAGESLLERLVQQELRHRRAATFFRGVGAALGYRPILGSLVGKANQNNYRFSKADTAAIQAWMANHLRASWVELPHDELDPAEAAAIHALRPLFNTAGNPDCCSDLAQAREECRQIARSKC
jgi:hypothetical protein